MKLLITGVPATRKTTIGNHLAEKHGFSHFDCESPEGDINEFLNKKGNKVITWGFMPGVEDDNILELQRLGYKMIWFDSANRKFPEALYIKRAKEREEELGHPFDISMRDLKTQMARIESMDLAKFNPMIVDTFDSNGDLLDIEIICQKIFNEVGPSPA